MGIGWKDAVLPESTSNTCIGSRMRSHKIEMRNPMCCVFMEDEFVVEKPFFVCTSRGIERESRLAALRLRALKYAAERDHDASFGIM